MGVKVWLALIVETVVFAALLFGGAGTLAWPAAWVYLGLFFGGAIWLCVLLARHDPALLAERMRPPVQKQQPLWDKIFLLTMSAIWIAWLPLTGLDAVRYHWSAMPVWLQFGGGAILLWSFRMIGRVFLANTFLAPVVKIQTERGHRVISTGPYAVVRHPLYSSVLIFMPASCLVLGSWYGLAGAALLVAGVVWRTVMEDRELHRKLPGYPEYAARVRYRLIPLVW